MTFKNKYQFCLQSLAKIIFEILSNEPVKVKNDHKKRILKKDNYIFVYSTNKRRYL